MKRIKVIFTDSEVIFLLIENGKSKQVADMYKLPDADYTKIADQMAKRYKADQIEYHYGV